MNGLLKFITCGSVDDGKSTLIGHVLYDTKLLYTDQIQALELESKVGSREGQIDYSLLLDGLMAEREQGITIDVAYRYFTTDKRSFIVADTPGHEEYTRNMAVGASFADLAVILIDASQGVLVQTRRHARICSLMGIRYFVFAVNKMDLVSYDAEVFGRIVKDVEALRSELGLEHIQIISLSATCGDNVTQKSAQMSWYQGQTFLNYLETVVIEPESAEKGFYMPVQRVCRPNYRFRGFQGQIEAGKVGIGDLITVYPSRTRARVKNILAGDKEVIEGVSGQPVTIELDREVDVSRGSVLASGSELYVADKFDATLLWMDDSPLNGNRELFVKIGTRLIPGRVARIEYKVDVNSGEHQKTSSLEKNEIGLCHIELSQAIAADTFHRHKTLGELILIDRLTNATSACGVIEQVYEAAGDIIEKIDSVIRARHLGQKPFIILVDDEYKADKTELELQAAGLHTMKLGAETERTLEAAMLLHEAGLITVIAGEVLTDNITDALKEATEPGTIIDLRSKSSENDRLLYDNIVNYSFYI